MSRWTKNRGIAHRIAADFHLPGGDEDDVRQEALIALWVAARTYEPEKGTFPRFAALVIKRHLVGCLRTSRRAKQMVLTQAQRVELNLDGTVEEVAALLPCLHQVSDQVETREELARLAVAIKRLTPRERECVLAIAVGMSYQEIGGNLKAIDNALFRARTKLRAA